jgi:hypothetical protein
MADVKQPNIIKIVAWYLVAKNLIKFANDEKNYKLTDKVLAENDFTKYPLSKGDSVEVGIVDAKVTYLRKQASAAPEVEAPKVEAPKVAEPEVKKEVPPTGPGSQELTVFAVAANKKVVKFTELKDSGWYQISEDVQKQDYATIGLIAKSKVMVLLNDKTVVSCARIASEPAETAQDKPSEAKTTPATTSTPAPAQTAKKEWKPTSQYNDDRQNSIECQACINSACQVVGMMAANIDPKPTANVLNSMIRAIAEENYKLLRDLKSK